MRPNWKWLASAMLALALFALVAGGPGAQDYGLRKAEIEIEGMT